MKEKDEGGKVGGKNREEPSGKKPIDGKNVNNNTIGDEGAWA